MFLGALIDAGLPVSSLKRALKALPLNGYRLVTRKVHRGAIHATKVDVQIHTGYKTALSLSKIRMLIQRSALPSSVKTHALETFDRLAEAEGQVHGVPLKNVHFHEIGVIDSLVDVIGCLSGVHLLGVTTISSSPVNLGAGSIKTEHGTLPVPAPAVGQLAHGVPVYASGPAMELTTPTGLGLLTTLTKQFTPLPCMAPAAIGYGAGSGNPKGWPNVLRIFLSDGKPATSVEMDRIAHLETNVDDLNPQCYESVMERLFAAGAFDVTLTPVIMKRSRPAIVVSVLAPLDHVHTMARVLFEETSTLGVRVQEVSRYVLPRTMTSVRLKDGSVRVKIAGSGALGSKYIPEYRDCKRIADKTGRPLRAVREEVLRQLAK